MKLWRLFSDHRSSLAWPSDWDTFKAQRAVFGAINRPGRIEGWGVLGLTFRHGQPDAWTDAITCMPNFDAYSDRLRQIITEKVTPVDEVQWLEATVTNPTTEESRTYWVVNPLFGPEAIDQDSSTYGIAPTGIIKAVYDPDLVGDRRILKYPYGQTPVVADAVKVAIETNGCTGLEIRSTPVRGGRSCESATSEG